MFALLLLLANEAEVSLLHGHGLCDFVSDCKTNAQRNLGEQHNQITSSAKLPAA